MRFNFFCVVVGIIIRKITEGARFISKIFITESIRLFPDSEQEKYFHKACSLSVHIYNMAKQWDEEYRKSTGKFADQQYLIGKLKEYKEILSKEEDYPLESHTLREGVFRYLKARERFFKNGAGFPKWQSLKYKVKKSFYVREDRLRIFKNFIKAPGLYRLPTKRKNKVKYSKKGTRFLNYKPMSSRIVFDGKYWFLRFAVEVDVVPEKFYSKPIGVDFGIKSLMVSSDGTYIDPIWNEKRYTELVKRKKGLQKKLSRQRKYQKKDKRNKPSNNYFKTLTKLRSVERHIGEFKKAFKIAVSKEITKNNPSVVVLENLKVSNMIKNKRLSPKIHEVGWYALRKQIEWEQTKKMGRVILADTFFPSSKMCSRCHEKKDALSLSERVYRCEFCGLEMDRDLNAAMNLAQLAM